MWNIDKRLLLPKIMKIKFKLSVVKVVEKKKGTISRLVTKMINFI